MKNKERKFYNYRINLYYRINYIYHAHEGTYNLLESTILNYLPRNLRRRFSSNCFTSSSEDNGEEAFSINALLELLPTFPGSSSEDELKDKFGPIFVVAAINDLSFSTTAFAKIAQNSIESSLVSIFVRITKAGLRSFVLPTTLAGFPATIPFAGTAFNTNEPAAIIAPDPTTMFPKIVLRAPINTLSWIFGCLSPTSFPVPPRVTP